MATKYLDELKIRQVDSNGTPEIHQLKLRSGALDMAEISPLVTQIPEYIIVPDTRDIEPGPEDLRSKAISADFKRRNMIGSPPAGWSATANYSHVLNIVGWSSDEGSGGWPFQMTFGSNGIALRQGKTATTWENWGLIATLDIVYPIGSIYISYLSTNPATLFGFGTWQAFASGRTIIGVNTSDTDFNSAGKTGGNKTNTIATTNLPSHTHSFSATSGANSRGHTHSVGAHSHGLNSHTHSVASHTHSIPALSGTAASAGSHSHVQSDTTLLNYDAKTNGAYAFFGVASQPRYYAVRASVADVPTSAYTTKSAGAHTHSVTTTASTTGGRALTTGAASGSTANSTAFTSGGESQNHTHSVSGTTGSTGGATALNTMDPYITVYMWRRTA